MRKLIRASKLEGIIKAPASKSCMQRLLLATLIGKSECTIHNIPYSSDVNSAISLAQNLGMNITINDNYLEIQPINFINPENLNCGESATALRMFIPYITKLLKKFEITGHGTILKRSFHDIEKNLKNLNIELKTNHHKLPFEINGVLNSGEYFIDGSHSSQLVSGLLMTFPTLPTKTILHVNNQVSIPYIELTLKILNSFGIDIKNYNYKRYYISGNQTYKSQNKYIVDGDWSSAANLIVAAAICGEVTITDLKNESLQADREILNILKKCGANIQESEDTITVSKSKLKAFEMNAENCPDLVPPLVALAVNCEGFSRISGINRLENKESNRINALLEEYSKMRANITYKKNSLIIEGKKIYGGKLWSHSDHRIAMSLTIAALNAVGLTEICEVQCVSKSYGNFFENLESLGANII